jgi:tryptophan-rich sensory protein
MPTTTAPRPRAWLALSAFLLAAFAAAALGGMSPPGEWYAALAKPSWNPPAWLFGPVWTALYTMMAVAAWRVWRTDHAERDDALVLWVAQLALNAAWTPLFFGLKRLDLALYEIVLLELMVLATLWRCWRIDRVAGALLVPYAAWVGFAAFLTYTLWQLNR